MAEPLTYDQKMAGYTREYDEAVARLAALKAEDAAASAKWRSTLTVGGVPWHSTVIPQSLPAQATPITDRNQAAPADNILTPRNISSPPQVVNSLPRYAPESRGFVDDNNPRPAMVAPSTPVVTGNATSIPKGLPDSQGYTPEELRYLNNKDIAALRSLGQKNVGAVKNLLPEPPQPHKALPEQATPITAGLLDFIRTPEGQGLLATAFGGLAGARRGQPINGLGRAGMSGIMGYGAAADRQNQMANNDIHRALWGAQIGNYNSEVKQRTAAIEKARIQQTALDKFNRGGSTETQPQTQPVNNNSYVPNGMGFTEGSLPIPDSNGVPDYRPLLDVGISEDHILKLEQIRLLGRPRITHWLDTPDAQGNAMTQGMTDSGQPVGSPVPKYTAAENIDPKIKQYEYAKTPAGGSFKGRLEDWIAIAPTILAGAQAPLRDAQVRNIQDENAYNLPQKKQEGVTVMTPNGVFRFKDQAAANKFRFEARIK